MENLKVMKITNKRQFETMVRILQNHPEVAKGQRYAENCMATNFTNVWEEITQKLNSLGPPVRDPLGWQKVWNDLKLKTKKKLAHNRREMITTGCRPNKLKYISRIEETVANLLTLDRTIDYPGRISGIPLVNSTEESLAGPETEDTINHTDEQSTEPSTSLMKPTRSYNRSDYRNQIKDKKNDLKKIVQLKEEKLKILKQRDEREKIEAALKKDILLLKKRKLELQVGEREDSNNYQSTDERHKTEVNVDYISPPSPLQKAEKRSRRIIQNEDQDVKLTHLLDLACHHLQGSNPDSEIIGRGWGVEYKKLKPDQQLYAKKAIDDILFEGRLDNLHRHSVVINHLSETGVRSPSTHLVHAPSTFPLSNPLSPCSNEYSQSSSVHASIIMETSANNTISGIFKDIKKED